MTLNEWMFCNLICNDYFIYKSICTAHSSIAARLLSRIISFLLLNLNIQYIIAHSLHYKLNTLLVELTLSLFPTRSLAPTLPYTHIHLHRLIVIYRSVCYLISYDTVPPVERMCMTSTATIIYMHKTLYACKLIHSYPSNWFPIFLFCHPHKIASNKIDKYRLVCNCLMFNNDIDSNHIK